MPAGCHGRGARPLARPVGRSAGAALPRLCEDRFVTDAPASRPYLSPRCVTVITRQLSNVSLHGITRASVLKRAAEAQLKVIERPFTIAEAQGAAEAFITAASLFVCPVIEIDGVRLGDGKPGPVAKRLREIYIAEARAAAI